jgi:hypothetical protein
MGRQPFDEMIGGELGGHDASSHAEREALGPGASRRLDGYNLDTSVAILSRHWLMPIREISTVDSDE